MPLKVACSCGRVLVVPDQRAGTVVRCPKCQEPVQIPGAAPVAKSRSLDGPTGSLRSVGPQASDAFFAAIDEVADAGGLTGLRTTPEHEAIPVAPPRVAAKLGVERGWPAPNQVAALPPVSTPASPILSDASPPLPTPAPAVRIVPDVPVVPAPQAPQFKHIPVPPPVQATRSEESIADESPPILVMAPVPAPAAPPPPAELLAASPPPPTLSKAVPEPPPVVVPAEPMVAPVQKMVPPPPTAAPVEARQPHETIALRHSPERATGKPDPTGTRFRSRPTGNSQRWAVWWLSGTLAMVALLGMVPGVLDVIDHFRSDTSPGIAPWAQVLCWLGAVQLVYCLYLVQLPDFSSVRVVAIVSVLIAAGYAMVLGLALLAKEQSQLLQSLQLTDQLRGGRATAWCFLMLCILSLWAYYAGRLGLQWRRAAA